MDHESRNSPRSGGFQSSMTSSNKMDPERLAWARDFSELHATSGAMIHAVLAELLADRDYEREEVDRLRVRTPPQDEDAKRLGVTMDHVRAWLKNEGFSEPREDLPDGTYALVFKAGVWVSPDSRRQIVDLTNTFMGTATPCGCARALGCRRGGTFEDYLGAWRVLEEMATVTDG